MKTTVWQVQWQEGTWSWITLAVFEMKKQAAIKSFKQSRRLYPGAKWRLVRIETTTVETVEEV